MAEYGLNTLFKTGRSVMCIADGDLSGMKIGGITLDQNTIAAVASNPVTLVDDTVVPVGFKYLRFGQILTKITSGTQDTITLGAGNTGGTFTVSVTAGGTTQTTAGVAYNATGATLQTAVQGLSNVGAGLATVTGGAGGPYTITLDPSLGAATVAASGAALTGGAATATVAGTTAVGSNYGMFGPYDSAAVDGRQTLTRGEAFILNRTWLAQPIGSMLPGNLIHPAVFDKGTVWRERLLITTGAHSLAAGPTVAEFETVFPSVRYLKQ